MAPALPTTPLPANTASASCAFSTTARMHFMILFSALPALHRLADGELQPVQLCPGNTELVIAAEYHAVSGLAAGHGGDAGDDLQDVEFH